MTADKPNQTTYNASGGRPMTNRQLATAARQDAQPGGHTGPHLDITRLTADTGFTPEFEIATAVTDYLSWRADNPR